ncbi:glutamine amidotransferase [Umezawaea tangerina]|uniref:GMP synthase (Glutamine-hydrolysing) n=1 Tax=Umezawaea tangerina TaxID=84725 RepID=A0A2T0SVM9_9PSEU|nr:glutamine amidotransferase [Umezawaea tangerina]PRY37474.1 GMP synthase (glutamine-hydrolysing) [Umezawaea tangerina]
MTKTALAVRHLAFEDLGLLHPLLVGSGHTVRYLDVGVEGVDTDAIAAADLVVVLGGPIGANDEDRYPFLGEEIAAIRKRLDGGGRTLGICLGAQLVARALGADVVPSGHTEIGYAPLELTPEGAGSPLRHLDGVPVLHWHNDRFDVPRGAVRLASTPRCPNQAFALGADVLALQFHLETDHRVVEPWLIGHAEALAAAGIHPRDIRTAAAAAGPALTAAASCVVEEWLRGRLDGDAPS